MAQRYIFIVGSPSLLTEHSALACTSLPIVGFGTASFDHGPGVARRLEAARTASRLLLPLFRSRVDCTGFR